MVEKEETTSAYYSVVCLFIASSVIPFILFPTFTSTLYTFVTSVNLSTFATASCHLYMATNCVYYWH